MMNRAIWQDLFEWAAETYDQQSQTELLNKDKGTITKDK